MSYEATEEAFVYLSKHPLFMDEIPENLEDYPELQAILNIDKDDTPYNNAKALNVFKVF